MSRGSSPRCPTGSGASEDQALASLPASSVADRAGLASALRRRLLKPLLPRGLLQGPCRLPCLQPSHRQLLQGQGGSFALHQSPLRTACDGVQW
jgi:hypothetical protein